jgi:hypothetical protein
MKRLLVVVLGLTLLAALAGCGQTAGTATEGLALGSAPWSDGDRLQYDWLDKNGTKVGSADYSFAKDGDAWLLSTAEDFASMNQTAKVRVDAQTLAPLGTEKTIKAQGTDALITTAYQGGKLDIKAVVNGDDKSATMDVPAHSLDNDQIILTLRALQFAEGYEGKYNNIIGQNATRVPTTIRVKGKEQVTVPAGTFEAWKVELDFGQAKHNAWYQVDGAHDLLQYDNGNIKLALTK